MSTPTFSTLDTAIKAEAGAAKVRDVVSASVLPLRAIRSEEGQCVTLNFVYSRAGFGRIGAAVTGT